MEVYVMTYYRELNFLQIVWKTIVAITLHQDRLSSASIGNPKYEHIGFFATTLRQVKGSL